MALEVLSLLALVGVLMGLNLMIEEKNEAAAKEDKDDEV